MDKHTHEWELTHPYIPSIGESQLIDVPRSDAINMIVCRECNTLASWDRILKALNAIEILGGPIGWGYDGMEWGSYITIPKDEWKKYAELVGLPTDWIPE